MLPTTLTPAERASAAAFIQWCASTYSRPGMKQVCLAAQDGGGLNVNCLLAAVWAARQGLSLTATDWDELRAAIAPIETEATQPIRKLRRSLQSNKQLDQDLCAGLKRLLLYAELRAEQAAEAVLHAGVLRLGRPGEATAEANLTAYAGALTTGLRDFLRVLRDSE
jgi:uncharacterized protein (TIGR02444 family)